MKQHDSFEQDLEVAYDLALRARTERDRRPAEQATSINGVGWKRPEFVGAWHCRTCNELVPIQEADMEHVAIWNRRLRARGEEPIDTSRIVFCDPCREKHREAAPEKRRTEVMRMSEVIRELKSSPDPDRELATIRTLRDLGHPDVDGLLSALRERAGAKTKTKRSKEF